MKHLIPVTSVLFILLSACTDGDESRRMLLESWGTHVIMPGYQDFEAQAQALQDRTAELCESPSATTLEAAQQAWWNARAPWKRMQTFAFGPYILEPWRLGPRVDSWPVRIDAIEQILFDTAPISADALGVFHKGFPVAEYLLHQPDVDLVADFTNFPRRCEYLRVVVADLAEAAKSMREIWDPQHENYLAELVDAGRGSTTFTSVHLALSEVVNRMAFTIEDIRADKLGRPLGTATGGTPQPDKAESQFSGRSIEDIRDNLRGIELLYFGAGVEGSRGLDEDVRSRGANFAEPVRDALAASREALDRITTPLTEAVIADPDAVSVAIDRLDELQRLIQVDILNALSLTPIFSDNDGD